MKKICVFILVMIVVSVMLCACGDNKAEEIKKIKAELIGGTFEGGTELYTRTFSFKANGTYQGTHTGHFAGMSGTTNNSGTYEVTEDAIVLTDDNGGTTTLTYVYNSDNGKLTLYFNGDVPLTKYG